MIFSAWGVSGTLVVTDDSYAQMAEDLLWQWIERGDRSVNRFLDDSEISIINRQPGTPHLVSSDFAAFFDAAAASYDITDGLCTPLVLDALEAWGYDQDITMVQSSSHVAPSASTPAPGLGRVTFDRTTSEIHTNGVRLDFGASAKAFVADQVAREVGKHTGVLVEIGGDVAVGGAGDGWAIGVAEDPDHRGSPLLVRSGGVATSSTLVRSWSCGTSLAHHIIDPATGAPAISPWRTVSVAASSCVVANAMATASIVWGDEAPFYVVQAGWAARFVNHNGQVLCVGGWPQEVAE